MGPAIHIDTTVKPVLGGHLMVHGQVSRDDTVAVQKRVKWKRKQYYVHEKVSAMPMYVRCFYVYARHV